MSGPTSHKRISRLWGLGVLFVAVCAIYVIRLGMLELSGENIRGHRQDGTIERTVIVQAVRGQIYDRNGTPLVTNAYTYDLTMDYAVLPADNDSRNAVILSAWNMLESCGDGKRFETYQFPFKGTFPAYAYREDLSESGSAAHAQFLSVVAANGLRRDAVLRIKEERGMNAAEANAYYDAHPIESVSADTLAYYFMDTYGLDAENEDGTPKYTDGEIDCLLRVLWGMEASGFSRVNDYIMAKGISMDTVTHELELGLAGIGYATTATRVYEYPGYASHILGQTGPIYAEEWEEYKELGYDMNAIVGKSGCEAAFESYLHGQDGVKVIVEDKNGVIVDEYMKVEPVAGKDVFLTIDIELQVAAEDALLENIRYIQNAYEREECRSGAIVAMDPNTGEILALASYPTYDLTTYHRDYSALAADAAQPLLDRALSGIYAPGSTFKPLMAAAALSEGEVLPSTLLECAGTYTYYQSYQPDCWIHNSTTSTVKQHGWLTAAQALEVSCNCYFYEAGRRLGIERMNRYATAAGFGEYTGIELGESTGRLAGPAYRDAVHGMKWQPTDTIAAAIGQSDNAFTPLQLTVATSTIANGGTRYAAHLLLRVRDFSTKTDIYTAKPETLSTLAITDTARNTVLSGMEDVITSSSSLMYYMRNVPVTVAGKTGTAQTGNAVDNGLFVCCAPSRDPEIVVTSVIEKAGGGSYSAMSAGAVLEAYYKGK